MNIESYCLEQLYPQLKTLPVTHMNEYDKQAADFLAKFRINFRATLSDSKPAPWKVESEAGHHYRITLSSPEKCATCSRPMGKDKYLTKCPNCGCDISGNVSKPKRITFDFWASIADREKGIVQTRAYDVLSSISGDVNCPEAFEDFCSEYGYDADSITALQTFRRCASFAKRLRAFFTAQEIEVLQTIN